jgi:hypothetical protein
MYKLSENIQNQPLPVCKFFVKKSSAYTTFAERKRKFSRFNSPVAEIKRQTEIFFQSSTKPNNLPFI